MNSSLNRRQSIKQSTAVDAGLATAAHFNMLSGALNRGEKVALGVMGTNGRGSAVC
jgi:hypothetical protein